MAKPNLNKNYNFIIKSFLLFSFILLLSFVACNADGGSVYNHLQNQDIIKGEDSNIVDNSNSSDVDEEFIEGGVFEHLSDENIIIEGDSEMIEEVVLQDYCEGIFSEFETSNHDLEQQAVVEQNSDLCLSLPDEPLVFDCDGVEHIYYSKDRCLAYFNR